MFEYSSFYEHVPKTFMFVSLADAVSRAQYEQELQVRPPIEEMFNQDAIDSLNPEVVHILRRKQLSKYGDRILRR